MNMVVYMEDLDRTQGMVGEEGYNEYTVGILNCCDYDDDRRSSKDNRCDWRCKTMKNDAEMMRKLRYKR